MAMHAQALRRREHSIGRAGAQRRLFFARASAGFWPVVGLSNPAQWNGGQERAVRAVLGHAQAAERCRVTCASSPPASNRFASQF